MAVAVVIEAITELVAGIIERGTKGAAADDVLADAQAARLRPNIRELIGLCVAVIIEVVTDLIDWPNLIIARELSEDAIPVDICEIWVTQQHTGVTGAFIRATEGSIIRGASVWGSVVVGVSGIDEAVAVIIDAITAIGLGVDAALAGWSTILAH